jgi:hypothetical protein
MYSSSQAEYKKKKLNTPKKMFRNILHCHLRKIFHTAPFKLTLLFFLAKRMNLVIPNVQKYASLLFKDCLFDSLPNLPHFN